jgi:hypothetical protein
MPRAWKTLYSIAERIEAMATNEELANRITKLETDVPVIVAERDTLKQQNADLTQQVATLQATAAAAAATASSPVDDSAITRLDAVDKLVNPGT